MKYNHTTFGHQNGWVDFEEYCNSKCTGEEHIQKQNGEIIRQLYSVENLTIVVVARKMTFAWAEWKFTYCIREGGTTIHLGSNLNELLDFINNYFVITSDNDF